MSIEFPCKYCNATIRVPDNARGGQGRCPKCGMKITVPRKSPTKRVEKPVVEEEPFVLPYAEQESVPGPVTPTPIPHVTVPVPEVIAEPRSFVRDPSPEVASTPAIFDSALLSKPRIAESPTIEPSPPKPVAKRSKKRKQVNNYLIISGVVGLLLLGIAGFVIASFLNAEQLRGDLIAGTSEAVELRPALIDKSQFKLSPETLTELLKKLEKKPVPLNSNSMQVELAGSSKGMLVSVTSGTQSRFYRVKTRGVDTIQKYLLKHASSLEKQRSKEVNRAATEFMEAYQNVLAKKAPAESITVFRDALAIPSLVGGFGHQLVAASGRTLYPCIYEDSEGGLYFLLPAGITDFFIIGRESSNGRTVVPAEFKVKVKGEIVQPNSAENKKPEAENSKSKSKNDQDEKKADDEMTEKK
jgi:DNA-directed RNA polymerase subunit RPC12/RpoP